MKDNATMVLIVEELEQEQTQVAKELQNLRESLKAEIDADLGEGDPYVVEQDIIVARIQDCERQLRALERTLEQAREGRYGICEQCHRPIDPARLEVLPDTTLCIKCKQMLEQKHHLYRPYKLDRG